MDKYNDWSKVLIEPASMNDARLFSLESRVHEEEEIRIKEYDFLRDLIKKLIYSLEQSNIHQIDSILLGQKSAITDPFGSMQAIGDQLKCKGSNSPNKGLLNQNSLYKSQTPLLPNLLNNSSLQNSVRDNLNKLAQPSIDSVHGHPPDVIMLKRLNFLRNSLQNHDPRERTKHLRE